MKLSKVQLDDLLSRGWTMGQIDTCMLDHEERTRRGTPPDVDEAALAAVAAEVSAAADRACPYWGGQPVALDPPVMVSVDDLFAVRTHNTGEDLARLKQLSAELARREQAAFAEVRRRAASWPVCRYGGAIRLSLMTGEESRGVEWRCNCGGVTK